MEYLNMPYAVFLFFLVLLIYNDNAQFDYFFGATGLINCYDG